YRLNCPYRPGEPPFTENHTLEKPR
ncbi:hypothetical protein Zm00014a_038499, partial [Zea mays]